MQTLVDDKLYRPSEVQSLIGCKNTKFYALVKAGAFEVRRLGGSTVIPGKSLRAFIESLPLVNEPKAAA
ncbi:MAG: hypothetical protein B7Z58_01780 [Acidiphilium sp. 37-64-53]|uniref:helix-turn-helix transcriptional regulator n=1 Tax=Acidiphilium TaxID=522 RepID=UPI000BCBB0DE|nr:MULTISPECIES: helix-turn-helix domain-containing protein [Acidiphilium]MEE3502754.1 helix-turn-helix domain-containing protein [Acidiphilium acidophilum]OYW03926.1 MAG: hypothetical protein B7Z58_01780 [Acidiphilium sp. 37-64-53]HQT83858.1 helix-turn-helix domain-containing protein [Acidiphilium rubrum]